jgi:hypothetical protein
LDLTLPEGLHGEFAPAFMFLKDVEQISVKLADPPVMTGTPKSGKLFSIRGVSISELQRGKISRNSDYYNPALLQQKLDE